MNLMLVYDFWPTCADTVDTLSAVSIILTMFFVQLSNFPVNFHNLINLLSKLKMNTEHWTTLTLLYKCIQAYNEYYQVKRVYQKIQKI